MKESDIQNEIMGVLFKHPLVAWAYVTTTGTLKGVHGGRPFQVGFNGLSDIMGQLKDGRMLAIEVKVPGKKPTEEQYDFLRTVALNNGLAFWADSADYVNKILWYEYHCGDIILFE